MRAFLSNDASFRYCLAEGCKSGQVHDSGAEGNIFRCGACGFRVCTIHDMTFHEGETCTQYDERLVREERERIEKQEQEDKDRKRRQEEEIASVAAVDKFARACPGCKRPIQKTSGCDHMTCEYEVLALTVDGTDYFAQVVHAVLNSAMCVEHRTEAPKASIGWATMRMTRGAGTILGDSLISLPLRMRYDLIEASWAHSQTCIVLETMMICRLFPLFVLAIACAYGL